MRQFPATKWRLSLPLAGAVLLTGCGAERESAPVSGRVTLNGEPQEGIFIYFDPVLPPDADPLQGQSKSYARTDKEGKFTLQFMDVDKDRPGAVVTSHTVTADDERTFTASVEPDGAGGTRPIKSRVPKGWTTTFEVTPEGSTEANFEFGKGQK